MVTVNNVIIQAGGTAEFEFKGLNSDTKPTGKINETAIKRGENTETIGGTAVGVNSLFLELDTGDLYYFTGSAWTKVGG